jgi:hypothetical protein
MQSKKQATDSKETGYIFFVNLNYPGGLDAATAESAMSANPSFLMIFNHSQINEPL